jgi:hypothetical protein
MRRSDGFLEGKSDLPPQWSGVAGVKIASVVTMGLGIGAIVSGVRGRRLAEAEGPGRVAVTIRLVSRHPLGRPDRGPTSVPSPG